MTASASLASLASSSRRSGRLLAALVLAAWPMAFAVGLAAAQEPGPPLVVTQVVPDAATDTITIDGEHFGPKPFVTLDLVPLDLRLVLETRLMAAVPIDVMPPGRYLLTVSRGPGPGDRASLEIALGRIAEPAARPPSPASPPLAIPAAGDPAAVVGDTPITVADVDREWQASDPGGYVALMRKLHDERRRVADRMATADVLARKRRRAA